MLELVQTKRTDIRLLNRMREHYSHPKGFVGRNICYAVLYDKEYYGHIVGGSAALFLPNRNQFFNIDKSRLNNIVNNVFFNVNGTYPIRNFTTKVVQLFCATIIKDWKRKYNDDVIGFETLVEKPRTGELYRRAGWKCIGETKGYSCRRIAGNSTEKWSGKRVWNTSELKPKLVLVKIA